jgi:sarcosine oxidase
MGAAAAWELARRGAEVVVHEQFELGHERGSSHGRSRIVRLSYPDPTWVRLAEEARGGWAELEAETGRSVLELHGLVEVASSPEVTSAAGLSAVGVEHRFLSPDESRGLGVAVPEGWTALYEPGGGIARADLALSAFLDAARARGARVEEHSRVDDPAALDADVVVVAAGAWLGRFFPDLPLKVTRETVCYFRLEGSPPPSVVELDEHSAHAFFSLYDPVHGLKAGAHHAGAEADPDEVADPEPELIARIAGWVGERLPRADPSPVGAETCLYTTTPDECFVLERRGRLVVGSACSGHGFKFAPAVGSRLADLALAE